MSLSESEQAIWLRFFDNQSANETYDATMGLSAAQRLNHDVFIIIFQYSRMLSNRSPWVIAAVCRLWRAIALATPKLWTSLDLSCHVKTEYILAIISRSEPLPLHVSISNDLAVDQLDNLPALIGRIQCLTLGNPVWLVIKHFPILERLQIDIPSAAAVWQNVTGWLLSSSRYPKLREIHYDNRKSPWLFAIDLSYSFTELRALSISIYNEGSWSRLIRNCASNLTSLTMLFYLPGERFLVGSLILPQLQHLSVVEKGTITPHITIPLDAPKLRSISRSFVCLGDANTGERGLTLKLRQPLSVTDLRICRAPIELQLYPSLCTLWIQIDDLGIRRVAASLKKSIMGCPTLTTIRYSSQLPGGTLSSTIKLEEYFVRGAFQSIAKATGRSITIARFDPAQFQFLTLTRSDVCAETPCRGLDF